MRYPLVRATSILAAAIAGHAALGTVHATTPLAPEFRVNALTAGHQYRNRISMSPTGEFVVTWTAPAQDGSGFGIMTRRFDAVGAPLGAELVINSHTAGDQQFSAVSINENGRFVVVWRSEGRDGDQTGISARLFDEDGALLGDEFQVNSYTPGLQTSPDVAVGPQGGFFVVWESPDQDGSYAGIFARRHNPSGFPQAEEFQVNEVTVGNQTRPRIAIAQPSDLIVVWSSGSGAVGRRLGQSGVVGAEFELAPSGSSRPALAPTGDSGFLATWQAGDGDSNGIFARRFAVDGEPLASAFQVNTYTPGSQFYPQVAGNGTDFVVVWSSYQDGDATGVVARRLDAAGAVGSELQINVRTVDAQNAPTVGVSSDGTFVVAWDSVPGPSDTDVIARRFTFLDLAALDVDADGTTEALFDGLLVIRFLFGFTGTSLTSDAVDDDCIRCDPGEIVTYLDDLGLVLDIDEDGETRPLTDGMLVLRFLFAFDGTALTAGVVGDGCMRCDAATEIEPYLESLD